MTRFLLDTGSAGDYINRRRGVYERARQTVARGDRLGIGIPSRCWRSVIGVFGAGPAVAVNSRARGCWSFRGLPSSCRRLMDLNEILLTVWPPGPETPLECFSWTGLTGFTG